MAAIEAVRALRPRASIHAMGYCLGGTLVAIAAAVLGAKERNPLKTLSLLAAQVDFNQPGELGLFIDGEPIACARHRGTLAALRLRALDMAIRNLLGSNLFNVAVLAIDDALYLQGPLLREVQPVHAATAITAGVMTGMVMIGLILRPQGGLLRRVSWVSVGLVAAYLLNITLAYLHG